MEVLEIMKKKALKAKIKKLEADVVRLSGWLGNEADRTKALEANLNAIGSRVGQQRAKLDGSHEHLDNLVKVLQALHRPSMVFFNPETNAIHTPREALLRPDLVDLKVATVEHIKNLMESARDSANRERVESERILSRLNAILKEQANDRHDERQVPVETPES